MSEDPGHRPAIAAHRVLGHGRGAALLRPDGELDWWCPDRFDATPLLWSLLDRDGASARWSGAHAVAWDDRPAGPTARTTVRIAGRRVGLWDGLVPAGSATAIVRLTRRDDDLSGAEAGRCGAREPIVHRLRLGGFDARVAHWDATSAAHATCAAATVIGIGGTTVQVDGSEVRCRVPASTSSWSGFALCTDPRAAVGWDAHQAVDALTTAERDDERSMTRIRLPYHHPERVTDALYVLHALTDADTGAPVASVTTSLPEAIGASRQFDYRYSWLRDSAAAVATASLLGHTRAARRYISFLASLRERDDDGLTPMTTTTGDAAPNERVVDDVAGWGGSRPVRVGNAAKDQLQLDAVATVLEALWVHLVNGGSRRDLWPLVDWLAERLARAPFEATSGIWELRTPRLLVTDELARWVGLHHAIRLRRVLRPFARRPAWVTARDAARGRVEAAIDANSGTLPQSFGTDVPDAAALLLATNRLLGETDPRTERIVRTTIARLEEGSFLRRYPPGSDDFDGVEAPFVPASWWAVSALCVIGDLAGAEQRADAMCTRLPRLLPEEWDVVAEHGLGNVPLLWSHSQAARALFDLHALRIRRRTGPVGLRVWRVARYLRLRVHR